MSERVDLTDVLIVPEGLRGPLVLQRVTTWRQLLAMLLRAPWALLKMSGDARLWTLVEAPR